VSQYAKRIERKLFGAYSFRGRNLGITAVVTRALMPLAPNSAKANRLERIGRKHSGATESGVFLLLITA
jgi:hypothetical protein